MDSEMPYVLICMVTMHQAPGVSYVILYVLVFSLVTIPIIPFLIYEIFIDLYKYACIYLYTKQLITHN